MILSRIAMPFPINHSSIETAGIVEHAYQPIVSTSSLRVHGFEALARLPDGHAMSDICELLDAAHRQGCLHPVERTLVAGAITKFSAFPEASTTQLFCNLDNRVFDDPLLQPEGVVEMALGCGLRAGNLCIELSERMPPENFERLTRHVQTLLNSNVRIAIDDFGKGFSGLHMLMAIEPHYVKIDRTFIDGLAANARKQAIVAKLNGLAHSLGFFTIAEGVENEADFRMARDLGCDLAQGYLIARPDADLSQLRMSYTDVGLLTSTGGATLKVDKFMTRPDPLELGDSMGIARERFGKEPHLRLIPVVDAEGQVHGALYEEDVRDFLISDFGPSLIANKGLDVSVSNLLRRCSICEANSSIETLVNSYVIAESANGIVLTLDGRYVGYLSNQAVLKLATEHDVNVARDQNPLTYLPGNNSIIRHISERLLLPGPRSFAFLDFDHFKAFNDAFGFQAGDNAIRMFADILRDMMGDHDSFCGHIGGDDFFLSLGLGPEESEQVLRGLMQAFAARAVNFYSPDERAKGGIHGLDRFDQARFFPMLRISAALLSLPPACAHLTSETITTALAEGKILAKKASDNFATATVSGTGTIPSQERMRRWAS